MSRSWRCAISCRCCSGLNRDASVSAPRTGGSGRGCHTGGAIGAHTALKLEDCPARIDAWAAAALGVNPEILVLAHGGPIAEPADADFIMKHTRKCHGFYGASSMERLPVERALTEQVRKFKAIGAR